MADADGFDAGESRFRAGLVGAHKPLDACAARTFRDRKDAADAPQPAVEGELSARRVLRQPVAWDLPRRGKERERDGQVEPRALLLQFRRREIDGRLVAGPLELGRLDAAANALL